ncbi:MAG TPA: fibronectin-binding domain-containing protein [Acidaminococcaceae bacterium]|nr:fibronectin-binding domain-containing protein [Acidaminococcaceae bacterium]
MNLEGITLYALTEYLKQEITGSRIYKIGMPSGRSLYFSLKREYDTLHLIIDVNAAAPSIRLADKAPDNPPEPPAFCMLLRKHLEEGIITQVRQYGLDRVIELEISLLGRNSQIITKQVIVELAGKNSNLVFAENGKILDSIKHVSPVMNSVRVIQPGYDYNPPPPQAGLDILTASAEAIVAAIPDEVTSSLWKPLVKETTGIGKASALQLLCAAKIPLNATYLTPMDRNRLASVIGALQKIVSEERAARSFTAIIAADNQCQTIFPYPAAYVPEGCRSETFPGINEALGYAARLQPAKLPEQDQLRKAVQSEIRKTEKKIGALTQDLALSNDADACRIIADSLMAALYQIQKGAVSCTVSNIYDGTPLQVTLSPVLTPAENAQKYYKKYNKLKRAQEEVAHQLAEATDMKTYLESIEESLHFATTRQETEEIKEELQHAGVLPVPRRKMRPSGKSSPLHIVFSESTEIYIGKNNRQNDEVTFKTGTGNDLWLHVQKIPGSHVLLKTSLPEPEPEALDAAVQLAAWFSKARGGSQIPVDCVPRRFVKKPSGAKPGFVIFTNQKTFYATPDEEYINNLLQNCSAK